mgnify:CR=1 FL=1
MDPEETNRSDSCPWCDSWLKSILVALEGRTAGTAMAEDTDRLDLTDRQKTRLLSLGLEPDRPAASADADEQRGDLLCDLLRCPLPAQPAEQGASSVVGEKRSFAGGAVMGPRLDELLLDPSTDLAVLRRVKEYAKSLGKGAESDVQKDAFLTIYFAAIAAAVVFHEGRITEPEVLLRLFRGGHLDANYSGRSLCQGRTMRPDM